MDDADLEKLSIKPGSLNPKFHRNTTEYNVTVASDVGKLTISCLTSDSNASYQIVVSTTEQRVRERVRNLDELTHFLHLKNVN